MYDQLLRQAFFGTAVLELCGLLVLVLALWWMRLAIRRRQAGEGGSAPAWVAGGLALATAMLMVGLALFAALVFPVVFEQMASGAAGTEEQQAMLDLPAPPLGFAAVADDRSSTLDELRGDVVLINFWATWCGPCLAEMPDLERLQRDLGPRGLRVIHLSSEPRDELVDYLEEERPANLHVYAESTQWPAFGLPTSYVVDRQGVVRELHVGSADYRVFAGLVEPYL